MTGAGLSFALLGSGEFEPWSEVADRWLLERATGDGTVLVLPTASAPEGDTVFDMWADKGMAHFDRLGIPAKVLPLKTREDADGDWFDAAMGCASVAYFSGGNPAHLAATLDGSRFFDALIREMGRGLAYAGCSAGIACLGDLAPDSSAGMLDGGLVQRPGLRLFPGLSFGPHWDALDRFVPGLRTLIESSIPDGAALLTVDEWTALLGDGAEWTVVGAGSVGLVGNGGGSARTFPSGASFTLPILSRDRFPAVSK